VNQIPDKVRQYDRATQAIWRVLRHIGIGGKSLANVYMMAPMLLNYCLVGASGTVLNWAIYEHIFRPVFVVFGQIGTFIGIAITTLLVFLWNFFWNRRWSLSPRSQVLKMSHEKRQELKNLIAELEK